MKIMIFDSHIINGQKPHDRYLKWFKHHNVFIINESSNYRRYANDKHYSIRIIYIRPDEVKLSEVMKNAG